MKKYLFIMFCFILNLIVLKGLAQPDYATTLPLPPLLKSVSVQTSTGYTVIKWNLSPSTDIAAYIVYKSETGGAIRIDTIWDPTATSYTVTNTASKYSSVAYVVAAMRLPNTTSLLSNEISSIFETVVLDSCRKEIKLEWNKYTPYPVGISSYSVMGSLNGGVFNELAVTEADKNSYVLTSFNTKADYCFYIRSNLNDGTSVLSNKECLTVNVQRPPDWINADFATVTEDKKISLSFTVDPQSETNRFILEKKNTKNNVWLEIAQRQSVNGVILFKDSEADISLINSYRITALNNCNFRSTLSNYASNIVLELNQSDDNIILKWNNYRSWRGELSAYSLFMNAGNGYSETNTNPPSDTTFAIRYSDIMDEVTGKEICFYIVASEKNNPFVVPAQSISSGVCTIPTEVITVPNVFTPDNDLRNDLFRPVLSFTPIDYNLIITDMQGKVLFESHDHNESWDGSSGSNKQMQSVCLWFLKIRTPSGKNITRTGTVTLIRNN